MTDQERAVMQQALEALELMVVDVKTTPTAYEAQRQAIAALRAALAHEQPMLTDDEIYDCREQGYDNDELNSPFSFLEAARAIERKVRGNRND